MTVYDFQPEFQGVKHGKVQRQFPSARRAHRRPARSLDRRGETRVCRLPQRRRSAARNSAVRLVERGAARPGAQRRGDRFPAGDRHGGDFLDGARRTDGRGDCGGGECTLRRLGPSRRFRHLQRADLLVAERQHLPRPALGQGAGDLRRMPVSDRRTRQRLRARCAGKRSGASEGRRHAGSTSPSTPARRRTGSASMPQSARRICARPICPLSKSA